MLPIGGEHAVWLAALHTGISFGWHTGTGIKQAERKIQKDKIDTWRGACLTFLSKSIHHYDVGFLLVTLSLATIFSIQNWRLFVSLVVFGFGSGLMYNDKENNPPEGVLKHIARKIRGKQT